MLLVKVTQLGMETRPVIPALGKWRQEDQFKASFNYIVNLMGDMSYYTPSKEEEVVGVYLSCSRACLADTKL